MRKPSLDECEEDGRGMAAIDAWSGHTSRPPGSDLQIPSQGLNAIWHYSGGLEEDPRLSDGLDADIGGRAADVRVATSHAKRPLPPLPSQRLQVSATVVTVGAALIACLVWPQNNSSCPAWLQNNSWRAPKATRGLYHRRRCVLSSTTSTRWSPRASLMRRLLRLQDS